MPATLSPPDTRSGTLYSADMPRSIEQYELSEKIDDVLYALDYGERLTITKDGVTVGELTPIGPRRVLSARAWLEACADLPPIDWEQFRADLDEFYGYDPRPRD